MKPLHKRIQLMGAALPWLAAAMLAVQATGARADRPLVSETADALARGDCVLDSAARRTSEPGAARVNSVGGVLGCGLFGSGEGATQFLLGYARASSQGLRVQGASVGGKTNLVEVKDGQAGIGLAYALAAVKAPGSGWKRETTSLVGLVTREIAKGVLGHANLGWARSASERKNRAVWSLGVETTDTLAFAADVFGESGSRPNVSAGVGYTFAPGWSLNAAYAKALESPRGSELSLGLRVAF